MKVLLSAPNPGHVAIAHLADVVPELTLITQNVDNLHERAGRCNVLHVHGSLHTPRCFACNRPYAYPAGILDEPERASAQTTDLRSLRREYSSRRGVVW